MKLNRRICFASMRAGIAVGLLAYLALSGAINLSALGGLLAAWPLTLIALLIVLADHVVTAWRLCVLLGPHGLRLSLAASTRLGLIGTFFNFCLPGATGGDVVRIYYATAGNRGRRGEVVTVLLLDRAIGLLGLLIWPLIIAPVALGLIAGSAVLGGLLASAAAASAALVGAMLIAAGIPLWRNPAIESLLWRLPLGGDARRALETLYVYRASRGTLLSALGISLLAHMLAISVTLLVAVAIDPVGFDWQMAVLVPLGFVTNALPLTPGGLGVGEVAFNQLFGLAGLSGGAEILLGWRLLTIACGLIGLVFYLQGRRRYVHQSLPTPMQEYLSVS